MGCSCASASLSPDLLACWTTPPPTVKPLLGSLPRSYILPVPRSRYQYPDPISYQYPDPSRSPSRIRAFCLIGAAGPIAGHAASSSIIQSLCISNNRIRRHIMALKCLAAQWHRSCGAPSTPQNLVHDRVACDSSVDRWCCTSGFSPLKTGHWYL